MLYFFLIPCLSYNQDNIIRVKGQENYEIMLRTKYNRQTKARKKKWIHRQLSVGSVLYLLGFMECSTEGSAVGI